jgi:predicted signal transduction protein with EAL and GGDEF domain
MKFEYGAQTLAISCSFGIARWAPDMNIDGLLRYADSALYEAKRGGRNRVVCAQPPNGTEPAAWSGLVREAPRSAPASGGRKGDALRA